MPTWWMRKISSSLIHFTFHFFSIESDGREEVRHRSRVARKGRAIKFVSRLDAKTIDRLRTCAPFVPFLVHMGRRGCSREREIQRATPCSRVESSRFVATTIKARERWEGGFFSLLELCSFSSRERPRNYSVYVRAWFPCV